MNVFVLSKDPREAAVMACDRHVVKMPTETAQLLCSAFRASDAGDGAPYRVSKSQYAHPCARWTRMSAWTFGWLVEHGRALCAEYSRRYHGREHAALAVIDWCAARIDAAALVSRDRWPADTFAMCCGDKGGGETASLVPGDVVVEAYRAHYRTPRVLSFAKWTEPASPPAWLRDLPLVLRDKAGGGRWWYAGIRQEVAS